MIRCRALCKWYSETRCETVRALDGVDLLIPTGTFTVISGPSGAGKTTLLCLLATLMRPTSGEIWLDDMEISRYSEAALTRLRRQRIGFIFQDFKQDFKLLPGTPAWRNVAYPPFPPGVSGSEAKCRALRRLAELGMEEHADRTPEQLSGGQQQRVAIARALVHEPELLFADEPTSNVDTLTVEQLLEIFRLLRREGKTVTVASHDPALQAMADEMVELRAGKLAEENVS